MSRTLLVLAAITIASSGSEANEAPSVAEQLNQYSAKAVIARSSHSDIFRRIVYKSTGRRLPEPKQHTNEQLSVPHTPFVREQDPLAGFVLRKAPVLPPIAPARRAGGLSTIILKRVQSYDPLIETYSSMNGLEPNLVRAVIYVESAGDQNAVSNVGAEGLMQLMPGTASDIGVSNSFDPAQNIYGGTRYLGALLKRFKRIDLALWGYNAGPGSVKSRRLPLETKLYIPNVLRIKAILDEEGA
jgi:soluble lytic murein transglycosylase-like protein